MHVRKYCGGIILVLAGCLNLGCQHPTQRYGACIGIPREHIDEYKRLHADVWPEVIRCLEKRHICNYSVYLGQIDQGEYYLFARYDYTGSDFEKDMARAVSDPTMQQWWQLKDSLQKPLPTRKDSEHWTIWKEIFYYKGPGFVGSPAQRVASIIGISEENIDVYSQLHAAAWPGVLASIGRCNIRNYSIFLGKIEPGRYLLFSYFEYIGSDFEKDMSSVGDEITRKWWTYTDPLQNPLPTRKSGEHWSSVEELFHID
jgi:L-rhamnose mutarotase